MTTAQKVIKHLAIAFAIFLIVSIFSGIIGTIEIIGEFFTEDDAVGDMKTYSVSGDIHDLNIMINGADLRIKKGDKLSVESNLNGLSVEENNGCLTVKDTTKAHISHWGTGNVSYKDAALIIYVPDGTVFGNVDIFTGAGKFTVHSLSAERIDLELGAGDAAIGTLVATGSANIEGGAGRVTVNNGALNDLNIEMGVGELNLTSALSGKSNLEMGVGKSNITLIGDRKDYGINVEKGLGSIKVDGKNVSDFGSNGDGENEVEIHGGVGSINISFKK